MSIMRCEECDRPVDTDCEPTETLNVDGYNVEVCERCADIITEDRS